MWHDSPLTHNGCWAQDICDFDDFEIADVIDLENVQPGILCYSLSDDDDELVIYTEPEPINDRNLSGHGCVSAVYAQT